jgi:hypothetical protein
MPIKHKFYSSDFGNGFESHNAILQTPYEPEVLILGTFNPDTPNSNFADFYYGRNYFWPAFKKLIKNEANVENRPRMPRIGNIRHPLDPSLSEVKEICARLKLTFADFIVEVFHKEDPICKMLDNDNVTFNNLEFNLIQDGLKNGIEGLSKLDEFGQIHWNTENIIDYIESNPTIKNVYLTRQPTGVWKSHWIYIQRKFKNRELNFTNIFTPSGQGKPVFHSIDRLLNHWIHNQNENFGKLDSNWLLSNGILISKF